MSSDEQIFKARWMYVLTAAVLYGNGVFVYLEIMNILIRFSEKWFSGTYYLKV